MAFEHGEDVDCVIQYSVDNAILANHDLSNVTTAASSVSTACDPACDIRSTDSYSAGFRATRGSARNLLLLPGGAQGFREVWSNSRAGG